MAKVRKQNNRVIRERRMANARVQGIGVVALPGDDYEIFDLKTGDFPKKSARQVTTIAHSMIDHEYDWNITVVGCLRVNGVAEYKVFDAPSVRRCYVNTLDNSLGEHIQKMVDGINPKYFLAVGWIATPNQEEIPMELIDNIFTKMKVWDSYITGEEDGTS